MRCTLPYSRLHKSGNAAISDSTVWGANKSILVHRADDVVLLSSGSCGTGDGDGGMVRRCPPPPLPPSSSSRGLVSREGFAVGASPGWIVGIADGESDPWESTAVGIDVGPAAVGTCEGASERVVAAGVPVLRRRLGAWVGNDDEFATAEAGGAVVVSFTGDVALRQMLARSS
jgi:hypothetical protein